MNQEQILGIIRHALTLAGGVLLSVGIGDPESMLEVTGGIVILVGLVWSWFKNK